MNSIRLIYLFQEAHHIDFNFTTLLLNAKQIHYFVIVIEALVNDMEMEGNPNKMERQSAQLSTFSVISIS